MSEQQPSRLRALISGAVGGNAAKPMATPNPTHVDARITAASAKLLGEFAALLGITSQEVLDMVLARSHVGVAAAVSAVQGARKSARHLEDARVAHERGLHTAKVHLDAVLGADNPVSGSV